MTGDDWWRGSVTYQIYPRSFMDSDGDGVGDLIGIRARLAHVADLGVDAIWLSPVFPSPMADMGYDVSDHTGIDPTFGTMADFDAVLVEAHRLGLKVIIDQVISHSADTHPLFTASRASRTGDKAGWYVWADPKPDGAPPNNWQSLFGGPAWEWDAGRRQYYFHNFLKSQPDFNYHNPMVQDWALSVMRFWLDRGVDGFRLDTVNYYFHDASLRDEPADTGPRAKAAVKPYDMQRHTHSKNRPENLAFLARIRALTDEYGARTIVGEVGDSFRSTELMGEYTSHKRLHTAYSFEMLGPDFGPAFFRDRLTAFFRTAPEGWPCWAFSNHDVSRHVTRWAKHGATPESLAKLAAALLLSFEGSVCLYQGEELGLTDTELTYAEIRDPVGLAFWPEDKGRDAGRTPMVWDHALPNAGFTTGTPWLPVKPPQAARAADTQGGPGSTLNLYRAMLRLRRQTPELRTGRTTFLETPGPILAFRRGDHLLCAFNLSPKSVSAPLPEGEILLAEHATQGPKSLALGPNGFAILRLTGAHP